MVDEFLHLTCRIFRMAGVWRRLATALLVLLAFGWSATAQAQNCAPATTQGNAPASWQTYCWLNLANYNDTQARSASGQNLTFTLPDGSQLSFNARVNGTTTAYNAVTAPTWTGAAVGNTAFIGIPGRPGLYTASAGTRTITLTNITIVPPLGATASVFAFVVADAESSNGGESLRMTTNGGSWQLLDTVQPISGSTFPAIAGVGSSVATITGAGGTVGAHIIGSNSPSSVTVETQAGGLQGVMFAVRFASIRLTKVIAGPRIAAADQFRFEMVSTNTGAVMIGASTSGAGGGPFSLPTVVLAASMPVTLRESMAAGSASTLAQYSARLTCVNTAGPTRSSLPNDLATANFNLDELQFGEALSCTFTNAAHPRVRLRKVLTSNGRRFAGDQFNIRIREGTTVIAQSTTTGTGTTITNGDTGFVQLVADTGYILDEIAAGTANLGNYGATISCSNTTGGSSTVLPTAVPGPITPRLGDAITCTITNNRLTTAVLVVEKSSLVISDPVSGTTNPKAIPGAIIEYSISVRNVGNRAVDSSSIVMIDEMPANVAFLTNSPVTFTNGTPTSGLRTFNAGTMVRFSSAGTAGPFTYTPVGTADPAVRAIRIAPTGTMAAATSATNQPSFIIRFRARIM
jgi:uncharacterized repeat protein (TIGR01451 family)